MILAKTAGFCMGVKRAMEKVLTLSRETTGPVFTYGPLIHNRQAVKMLEGRGIKATTDFDGITSGTVLLRTHGVPPDVTDRLRAAGFVVEDGTCPHVLRGQKSIASCAAEGFDIIIAGDRNHDEVLGLAGHTTGHCRIIESVAQAQSVPLGDKVLLVAQTTFNRQLFDEISGVLRSRKEDIEIVDTICNATDERQAEVLEIAKNVDAMVVVGGFHSANTRRLAEISESVGTPTFHVETASELEMDKLSGFKTIGVTAGASTPSWITSTVIDRLEKAGEKPSLSAGFTKAVSVALDSNISIAAGAAAMAYAAIKMMGIQLGSRPEMAALMLAASGYIFAAYSIGRRAETASGEIGFTRRSIFYRRHLWWMTALTAILGVAPFAALVRFKSPDALLLLTLSYIFAGAYVLVISRRITFSRFILFKNIPALKDLLSAAGWTVVTVFIPLAASQASVAASTVISVASFVFGLTFVRSVMIDSSDVTADRLLGHDTLPAVVGVIASRKIMAVIAAAMIAVIFAGSHAGIIYGAKYWMALCPAYVLCYVTLFGRSITGSEHRTAAVVDGGTFLAGVIALAYVLMNRG